METLALMPTSSLLPDIDDVQPLSDKDQQCLLDIKNVLAKHGALSRFGLVLLHQHFRLEDDEVLMETCDKANRVLISTPVKATNKVMSSSIATNWRLDTDSTIGRCTQYCEREYNPDRDQYDHLKKHRSGL